MNVTYWNEYVMNILIPHNQLKYIIKNSEHIDKFKDIILIW